MHKKRLFITIAVLLLSLALAGLACSPAADDSSNGSETTVPAETTTTETAADETTTEETTTTVTETEPARDPVSIRIGALRGPTGMGLAPLMASQDAGETLHDYSFVLAGAPDEIVASLTSGQIDLAAVPTNLAAVLYQRTGQRVQMLAVNTLGVLYILEKGDSVQNVNDLAGRTLQSSGQGAVPEYALNYILAENGLTDVVDIVYRSEHAELATLALAGQADLVMLPEPFVTTVLSREPEFRIALNLTEEWQAVQAGSGTASELAMGGMVVRSEFAQSHPEALQDFLVEYAASVDAVNRDPQQAGILIEQYGIMPDAELAARAIPNSYIVMIAGADLPSVLDPFLAVLYAANPQAVGGQLPDPEFYFTP